MTCERDQLQLECLLQKMSGIEKELKNLSTVTASKKKIDDDCPVDKQLMKETYE